MFDKDSGLIPGANLRGWKMAQVVSNEDPKGQERILIRVLGVHNMNNTNIDNAIWANHCAPTRSGSGDLPEPNDWVYVHFINAKDFMACIWFGFVRSSFQDGLDGNAIPLPIIFDVYGNSEIILDEDTDEV